MDSALQLAGTFGALHFGGCQLGDRRRTRRLVDLAGRILAHPHGALPQTLHDPAAYRAFCRLVNHPAVTHEAALSHHRRTTLENLRRRPGVTLLLHGTTELDFSGHTSLSAL